ncbi:MAG: protein kinase [Ardenticatenaceae bacterium]|nr:protein kinase [Ardenticatenaceae bacterium]
MSYLIGKQIDHYQIEALLGEGGMASVYRAYDLSKNQSVAFKIMHAHLAHQAQFQERFAQESRAVTNFNSPAIIKIFQQGAFEGVPYLVMEYLPGGSLTGYLKQLQWTGKRIALHQVVTVGTQVAEGLSYAHQRGLIHRDVKPDNILLKLNQNNGSGTGVKQAVICDFGLAMLIKDAQEMATNPFMGSLPYMSPEQCANMPLDGRSDIYSLGIVLYQLSTGQLPFKIEAPADIVKHLQDAPLPPRLVNPDLPNSIENIILKTLAKKPGDRYQTGAELAHALRQIDLSAGAVAAATTVNDGVVTQWIEKRWLIGVDVPNRIDVNKTWITEGNYRLLIAHPWEESRIVGVTKTSLTIGRQPGNDIVLDDNAVSGQHVRLERTESGWQVSDLGSTNGTFLDSVPVEFNKPREWLDDQTLQIGSFSLRWQSFAKTQHRMPRINWQDKPAPAPSSNGPKGDGRSQNGSPKNGVGAAAAVVAVPAAAAVAIPDFAGAPVLTTEGDILSITITPAHMEVTPGAEVFLEVSVQNVGTTVEDIFIRVEESGLPVSWITVLTPQAKLLPNETHTTTMTAVAPQNHTVVAGPHTYHVIATTSRGVQEVIDGSIAVAPFEDFALDMHPRNLQEKVTSRLTIADHSNFDNKYTVAGIDDSDALLFEFDEPRGATLADFDEIHRMITVPAGTQGTLGFRVKPKKRPWFRTPTSPFPYKVRVRTETRDWQTLEGQLEVKPRISRGAIIFFILLLLILGLLGYWLYLQIEAENKQQLDAAQATAAAIQATADAVGATATAAQSAASAAQGEASAIRLTAEALAAAGQSEEAAAAQATADALQATADALQAIADQSAADIASAQEDLAAAQEELAAAQEVVTPTPVPPPTDITLDNLSVEENSDIGTTVGSFAASSSGLLDGGPEVAGLFLSGAKPQGLAKSAQEVQLAQSSIRYTYDLVSGTGDDDNDAFFVDGVTLKTAVAMDYETKATYSIRVEADNGLGGTFAKQFTILIDDENDTPALSISDVTANENAGTVVMVVEMTNDSLSAVSVDYTTSDSTAVAGTDYTGANGSLTWAPGETGEKSFSITLLNDEVDEPNETFNVTLSNAEIGVIADGTALVSIVDDDATPTLTIADVTIAEGATSSTILVTMEGLSSADVTVSYASADVSATSGTDYTALSGTLTWAAGETGDKTLTLSVTDDAIDEQNETLSVVLSGPANATLEDGIGTVTITDNDAAPTLAIQDVGPVQETGDASITVIMTGLSSASVTVNYATSNDTATAGSDYTASSGTLTWAAGSTGAQLITVPMLSDVIDEPDETFIITLSNATNATITDDTAVYTITDDDDTPTIELLGNKTVSEDAGSVELSVRMNGGSSEVVTVDYVTVDGTAGSGDYDQVLSPSTLAWSAGQVDVVKTIEITINDDQIDENNENFSVALSNNSSNSSIQTGNATVTISDNDTSGFAVSPLTLSISEPNGNDMFNISLLTQPTDDVTIPLSSGTNCSVPASVTINVNDWSAGVDVTVTAVNDAVADGTQTCTVTTGDPTSTDAIYDALTGNDVDNVTVTVLDDDVAGFTVSPLSLTISEPNGSDSFNVKLTSQPTADVTVPLSANSQCTLSAASVVLTSVNWNTGVNVTVTAVDDAIADGDQSCPAVTGNPTSSDTTYNALDAEDVDDVAVTVEDDDSADILVSPLSLTVTEPNSTAVFSITLNSQPIANVSIAVDSNNAAICTVSGGPATLTPSNWNTGVNLTVTAVDDDIDDGNQTCIVQTKPATSLDPNYNNLDADDVTVTVADDDTAGVTVTESGGTAVAEGGATDSYTIVLDSEPTANVILTIQATTNVNDIQLNGAGAGNSTQLTFTSSDWDTPQSVTVAAIDDFSVETSETSVVGHSATSLDPNYASIAINTVSVTVTDNDTAGVIVTESGGSTNVSEDGATDTYELVLTSLPTANVIIVADPDNELDLGAGTGAPITITFQTTTWNIPQTITVTAVDDAIDEVNPHSGTILHTASSSDANYNNIPVSSVVASIVDNDSPPVLTTGDISVTEGDSGTVLATLTVTMTGLSFQDISVNYLTADGTATSGTLNDYIGINPAQTVTWLAGTSGPRTINLTVNGDVIDEGLSEDFFVNFSGVTGGATMPNPQAQITILDDDDAPALFIADASVLEETGGNSTAVITVTMTGSSGLPISVDYATTDGTAVAGLDYTAATNTLNWAAGDSSPKFINISVATDSLNEFDETFLVDLSNAVNATIGTAQSTVTIVDDDFPTLAIADASIVEGTGGATTAVITVTITGVNSSPVTVNYATANDVATAGSDYTNTSGLLTWNSGDVSDRVISIPINTDNVNELDETFFVNLTNPGNATLTNNQGVVTIVDDDLPSLGVEAAVVDEGSGTVAVTVTVAGVSSSPITVQYATADDTAVAGVDYTAVTTATFTWNSGDTTARFINVPISSDGVNEYDETFFANIFNPTNANILDNQATVTIVDDDLPTVTITDTTIVEGTGGTTTAVLFVTITGINSSPVTVNYATADDTANAGSDYTAQSGLFTWTSGDTTSRVINIPITTDSISELDETLFLNLTNPANATTSGSPATITITNDDIPTLAVQDVLINEGTGGTTTAVVSVAMTGVSASPVSVQYNTADDTATAGVDYTAVATNTLNWAGGDGTAKTFNVTLSPDAIYELDETFFANIFNATNATITDNQGVVTIVNDEAVPDLTIVDVTMDESIGTATFTVTQATVSSFNTSVNFATANGSANSPGDYTATSGTLVIPAGATTGVITVTINDDATDELNETFNVNLSGVVNGTIGDNQGVGTIVDNDGPLISIGDVTITETEPFVMVPVTLSIASVQMVTVTVNTGGGTATPGTNSAADYNPIVNGTLTITAGSLTGFVQVNLICNGSPENPPETFNVILSLPINGVIIDGIGVITLLDDGPNVC